VLAHRYGGEDIESSKDSNTTLLGLQQFLDDFYYTPVIMGVISGSRPSIWTPYRIHPEMLGFSIPGCLHQ